MMSIERNKVFVVCENELFSRYKDLLKAEFPEIKDVVHLVKASMIYNSERPTVHYVGDLEAIPDVIEINNIARIHHAHRTRVTAFEH